MSADPKAVDVVEARRDLLAQVIADHLSGTWHCTRVWEAWSVGTMSRHDFSPVDESETPQEVADAILNLPEFSELTELLRIARELAAIGNGLNSGNSSAEERAARLAEDSRVVLARIRGAP